MKKKSFELVLLERKPTGEPTGRKLYIASDKGSDLHEFYMKNRVLRNKKRKKSSPKNLPTADTAGHILKNQMETWANKAAEKATEKATKQRQDTTEN